MKTGDEDAGYGCVSWRDAAGDGSSIQEMDHTLKKIGVLLNPQKRFRLYKKVSKHVLSSKNTIKNSTKLLKDLPVYRWKDPSPTKPFFKFSRPKIGFVAKCRTFRVSHENLMVSY